MGYILLAIIILVAAYFAFIYVVPALVFLLANFWIVLVNLSKIVWVGMQNSWGQMIEHLTYLDKITCSLSQSPVIAWGIVGVIVAVYAAFLYSVIGKRRSYLKIKLIWGVLTVALIVVISLRSLGEVEDIKTAVSIPAETIGDSTAVDTLK